jgi:hypothetical protein
MSTLVPPILQYRGPWFSALHLPDQAFLDALGDKMPFAFLMYNTATDQPGASLPAQQTGRGSFNAPEGAYITHLVASDSQAAGFMAQFFDSERQVLWNADPIFFGNGFGSAQKPYYLKRPYRVPANGLIQSKITNLATAAALIQIVAWGVRD